MIATHFPPQSTALGVAYHSHGLICALHNRSDLGRRADIEFRRRATKHHRAHRYTLTGVLVADICGIPGRVDLPTGTYHDFITAHGGDDGRQVVTVHVHGRAMRRRHHR